VTAPSCDAFGLIVWPRGHVFFVPYSVVPCPGHSAVPLPREFFKCAALQRFISCSRCRRASTPPRTLASRSRLVSGRCYEAFWCSSAVIQFPVSPVFIAPLVWSSICWVTPLTSFLQLGWLFASEWHAVGFIFLRSARRHNLFRNYVDRHHRHNLHGDDVIGYDIH